MFYLYRATVVHLTWLLQTAIAGMGGGKKRERGMEMDERQGETKKATRRPEFIAISDFYFQFLCKFKLV